MKRITERLLAVILCLAAVLSLFSGCSTEEEKNSKNLKKLTAGASTAFFGAESLDTAHGWDGWIMSVYGISENLFRLDSAYNARPWLVDSYEQISDTIWKFKIKDNVKFSNGEKVTAQAVKDCFNRTYDRNERTAAVIDIKNIDAENQLLTIETAAPHPTMLNDLCDPLFGIYDANGIMDDTLGVSCTGPYMASEFAAMTEVKMVKNPYYWGSEPKLDEVDLKIMDDSNALNIALQSGEIDMIARLDASSAELFSDNETFTVSNVTTGRSDFLMYNLNTAGLDDLAVRRAIGYCIDRENFSNIVYNGYASACYGVYAETLPFGSTDNLNISVDKYDIEKAKQILKEAGYKDSDNDLILEKDGKPLSFNMVTYSYNNACMQLADMLESSLKDIGIKLEITTYDVLDDCLAAGEFDIAVLSYSMAPTGTPQYFINMLFATDASNNYGGYSNNQIDRLADELKTVFNTARQTELTEKICNEIINDKPFDFIVNQDLIFVWNNKVEGIEVNPSEYYLITSDIDIKV